MAMTREELNRAFREVAAMEFVDVPLEDEISLSFSSKFINKMNKLIMNQKKSFWKYVNTAKKRVAIVAIALLSLFMAVLGNEEVRASMLQWCKEVYEEYTHYFFEGEMTKEITHKYQLMMVPEGFEVVQEIDEKECRIITYQNENGERIIFEQWATEGHDYIMDNERLKWSTVIINGKNIELFVDSSDMGAMWTEDGYFFFLIYYACEDIEIIKELVLSIE